MVCPVARSAPPRVLFNTPNTLLSTVQPPFFSFFHRIAHPTRHQRPKTADSDIPSTRRRNASIPALLLNHQHYHMIQTRSHHHHAGTPHVSSTRARSPLTRSTATSVPGYTISTTNTPTCHLTPIPTTRTHSPRYIADRPRAITERPLVSTHHHCRKRRQLPERPPPRRTRSIGVRRFPG